MKKIIFYISTLAVVCTAWMGCKRDSDYVLVKPGDYISNFDLRKLYKNADLQLSADNLGGATSLKGIVISDNRAGNGPAGLLILQNSRITGSGIDSLRGIAINIGAEASKYNSGDSVHVKIDGGTLKRQNGILQIQGVSGTAVNKMASNRPIKTQIVTTGTILSRPSFYECTLVTIGGASVEPEPVIGETFAGDKTINDGSGKAVVHTEATAAFAANPLLVSGNFTGIPFINDNKLQLWMRSIADYTFAELPKFSPAVISGYLVDPAGTTDANYEYVQFLATKDIDFSKTPFSVYTTNNAGSTNPFPSTGWNLGGARTYKFNLTTGTVSKGEYFYVGGSTKLINGSGSTNISASKWIASVNYTSLTGADGVGAVTNNLLANSGNIAGIAIFEGTKIDVNTVPLDVIFYGGTGGNFYRAGPPEEGYRITTNDLYNANHPATGLKQGFMGAGTNTFRLGFPNANSFVNLGGVYDAKSFKWTTKRSLSNIQLTTTTPITAIEVGTKVVN